jgi:hypothetical protein
MKGSELKNSALCPDDLLTRLTLIACELHWIVAVWFASTKSLRSELGLYHREAGERP